MYINSKKVETGHKDLAAKRCNLVLMAAMWSLWAAPHASVRHLKLKTDWLSVWQIRIDWFRSEMFKIRPEADHSLRTDCMRLAASILICVIHDLPAFSNRTNKSNKFSFYLMVAAPLCNFTWLSDPCCDLFQLISAMATVDKKMYINR